MLRWIIALHLLFLPPHALAQMGHPLTPPAPPSRAELTISYGWLYDVMGFTFCLNDRGHAFVRAGLTVIDKADTEAHELKHVEQMERFGTCEAYDKFTTSLKGRVLLEAEAYAAGLCESLKMGADRVSLERNYAERISHWVTKRLVPPIVIVGLIQKFERC